MENLTASQAARYIAEESTRLDTWDVMYRLPAYEGAHVLIGAYRVTCTDDTEMLYSLEFATS
jgi:hypothetical protein